MKFLVISKQKYQIPPEAAVPLIDAFMAYIDKYTASGKLETIWSYAGGQDGGGIANVGSLDELDALLAEYPFRPFSDVEIHPLVDTKGSIQRTKQRILAMAQMSSG